MKLNWNSGLVRRFCRLLPPPLAFRLFDRLLASRLDPETTFEEVPALFGTASISSNLEELHDAMFAYLGTASFSCLALARLLLSPGDTAFEIGANLGTETLSLAALVGSAGLVLAVEPLDENASRLQERIVANRLDQVMLIRKGVSNASAKARVVPGSRRNSGTAYLIEDRTSGGQLAGFEVETVTLDSLAHDYGCPRLLWLDIEGYELKALRGATTLLRDYRPFVLVEVDSTNLGRAGGSLEELLKLIQDHRYRVFRANLRSLPEWSAGAGERRHVHEDWLLVPKEEVSSLPKWRRLNILARFLNWYPGDQRER